MHSERLWIVLLTLVVFLAGLAGGVLLRMGYEPTPAFGAFVDFEARFAETFDLDPRQREDLRYILRCYEDDLEELKVRGVADHEEELVEIGLRCKQRIRKYVLPEPHLERFDSMVAGMWSPPDHAPAPTSPEPPRLP
jgi:hypothetical protein